MSWKPANPPRSAAYYRSLFRANPVSLRTIGSASASAPGIVPTGAAPKSRPSSYGIRYDQYGLAIGIHQDPVELNKKEEEKIKDDDRPIAASIIKLFQAAIADKQSPQDEPTAYSEMASKLEGALKKIQAEQRRAEIQQIYEEHIGKKYVGDIDYKTRSYFLGVLLAHYQGLLAETLELMNDTGETETDPRKLVESELTRGSMRKRGLAEEELVGYLEMLRDRKRKAKSVRCGKNKVFCLPRQ